MSTKLINEQGAKLVHTVLLVQLEDEFRNPLPRIAALAMVHSTGPKNKHPTNVIHQCCEVAKLRMSEWNVVMEILGTNNAIQALFWAIRALPHNIDFFDATVLVGDCFFFPSFLHRPVLHTPVSIIGVCENGRPSDPASCKLLFLALSSFISGIIILTTTIFWRHIFCSCQACSSAPAASFP